MQLLDHVSISVRDLENAKPFYKAIFKALGAAVAYERSDAIGFGARNRPNDSGHSYLSIYESAESRADPKRHWCFRAEGSDAVRAFYRAGLSAGGCDAGEPGLRSYHPGYYAAFLLDPEGNKVEAVFHEGNE